MASMVGTMTGSSAQATVTPPSPGYFTHTVHAFEFEPDENWGTRTRVTGDFTNDGANEMWTAAPGYSEGNGVDPTDPSKTHSGVSYGRVFLLQGEKLADPNGQIGRSAPHVELSPPEKQPNKQFGFALEVPGDLNGNGKPDVVVGTDAQDVPFDQTQNSQICNTHPEQCHQNEGKAWAFDGDSHNVLFELTNPHPQGSDTHRARFGSRIGRAGDVNGDGRPDIIVGASGNDQPSGCSDAGVVPPGCRKGQGQAFIFSGANGALIRELNLPVEDQNPPTTCPFNCGSFGLSVQGPGDVDGDGVPDQLVDAGSETVGPNNSQGRMYVFSGATGALIRRIDDPAPQANAIFGFQDATPLDPGDVNADGHADLYGNGFTQAGPTGVLDAGRAWVFNGAAGTPEGTPVLYEFQNQDGAKYGAQFGWSMTRDRNRNYPAPDGSGDDAGPTTNPVYIGNSPHHAPGNPDQNGNTNTFDASSGTHLQNLPLPPPWNTELGGQGRGLGPNLGWTVSSPGDLNHDGFRDFVAGAPFTDVCEGGVGAPSGNKDLNVNQGVIISFVSNPSGTGVTPVVDSGDDNACSPGAKT